MEEKKARGEGKMMAVKEEGKKGAGVRKKKRKRRMMVVRRSRSKVEE